MKPRRGSEKKDPKELFEFDREKRSGGLVLCGVDEAGRGPLAGPVYAAAVILPEDAFIEGVNDSKKLTEKRREALYDKITACAVSWCVASASVAEIEELNILNATFLAMRRAVEGLSTVPSLVLVDGNRDPGLGTDTQTLIGGDALSASVAAASILAKVTRDRYMYELAKRYPEYEFDRHKGYGTARHFELTDKYGLCPEHRPSFFRKRTEKK